MAVMAAFHFFHVVGRQCCFWVISGLLDMEDSVVFWLISGLLVMEKISPGMKITYDNNGRGDGQN
jgi:hypothetical protein